MAACFEDIGVDVVKTGMLASAATIQAVAEMLVEHRPGAVVVDPVMVATTGAQLLPSEAVSCLRSQLLSLATVLTPNLPEARLLLADAGYGFMAVETVADLEALARALQGLGPAWVLIKGGHVPFRRDFSVAKKPEERQIVLDVLVGPGGQASRFEAPYQKSQHTHGTGCSLACK
jgi:hydroxymethylpyrimidine/phosphomethylpyrimidine kinase / thiaminase